MNAHQYALKIEHLYRRACPSLKRGYADLFEENPIEEFDLLLNYLCAADYLSSFEYTELANKITFTQQSLRDYIQIPENEEKLVGLINRLTKIITSITE